MSPTAERYRELYRKGRVTAQALQRAVEKGLVTQEEYDEIIAED